MFATCLCQCQTQINETVQIIYKIYTQKNINWADPKPTAHFFLFYFFFTIRFKQTLRVFCLFARTS